MSKLTIAAAVRKACAETPESRVYKKITRALELLGVDPERAHNFGLGNFDEKNISKAVRRYFDANPVGRPVGVDGRNVNVFLDATSIAIASELGSGNVSAGIRAALKKVSGNE